MAKWKSPIFSDIRNKLGENVVFSMWKGRQYMRSYTKPANPKTTGQTANRLHMAYLVGYWQSTISTHADIVTLWNAAGLSDLISGFNRFVKALRGYVISAVTLDHASFTMTVDSVSVPANELQLYVRTPEAVIYKCYKYGPGVYTASDFGGWTPAAGDSLRLADKKVLGDTVLTNENCAYYGALVKLVDESTGTIRDVTLT